MTTKIPLRSAFLTVPGLLLTLAAFHLTSTPAYAATMVGYYSLDNLTTGLENQGTAGNTAAYTLTNYTSPTAPSTLPTATTGFLGGGLSFNGTSDAVGMLTAQNYGIDQPFSMSVWVYSSGGNGQAMSLSARASSDRYLGMGVQGGDASIVRRNTAEFILDSNTTVSNGWHQVVASFVGSTDARIYVDGKLVITTSAASPMVTDNTFTLGGVLRTSSGNLQMISRFAGSMDDAGLFSGALSEGEVALVNGLGRTATLGLNWLDEAATLSLAPVNTTAVLNGYTWQRVSGLTGSLGDYGGTVGGGNAYIITDGAGNGIQVVPEPGACLLLAGGLMALSLRRRRL